MSAPKLGPPLVLEPRDRDFILRHARGAKAVLAAAPALAWVRLAASSGGKRVPSQLFVAYGAPRGLPQANDAFAAAAWRFQKDAVLQPARWLEIFERAPTWTTIFDVVFTRGRAWMRDETQANIARNIPPSLIFRGLAHGDSAHQRLQDVKDFAAFKPLIGVKTAFLHRHSFGGEDVFNDSLPQIGRF